MATRVPFSICVFCGSAPGGDPAFADAARTVGREIASRGWTLVYGGGSVGLMGILADAALAETLTERKVRMGDLADAFLSLPGGIGTLDELFEALSWAQLGLEQKPNGLLNVSGYYDSLIAFLDRAVETGFLKPKHRELLISGSDVPGLLDRLSRPLPPSP